MDYQKYIDDNNRKEDEKNRQWRRFYEEFAKLQEGRLIDYS